MLNCALIGAELLDFIRIVDLEYIVSRHLTMLLKEGALSNALIPVYNNILITTI